MSRSIGFIGMGNMGSRMASRLLEAGFDVTVYNRTPGRADPLIKRGAKQAKSPSDLAKHCEIVISSVADGDALMEVAMGEDGLVRHAKPGLVYVEMSTVSPIESARVATACNGAGIVYLRAPVTGSTYAAESGTLKLLVSGPRDQFDGVADVLRHLGPDHFYLGPGEEARVLKLAINMLIGVTMVAFAEAVVLGKKAGLDWDRMLEVFGESAIASPFLKFKAKQLAERDFSAAFSTRMMCKDFDLALGLAKQEEVAVPVIALARQLLQGTAGLGWGDRDMAAIVLFLERAAGIEDAE